jgi:hypothetical protein
MNPMDYTRARLIRKHMPQVTWQKLARQEKLAALAKIARERDILSGCKVEERQDMFPTEAKVCHSQQKLNLDEHEHRLRQLQRLWSARRAFAVHSKKFIRFPLGLEEWGGFVSAFVGYLKSYFVNSIGLFFWRVRNNITTAGIMGLVLLSLPVIISIILVGQN